MSVSEQPKEDLRFCHARLQIILDTLLVTVICNPIAVVVASAALYLGRSEFGVVPLGHMAAAVGVQLFGVAAAYVTWRRFKVITPSDVREVRQKLILLQGVIGLCWGAVAWALWVDGNGANNGIVAIVLTMAAWGMAITRCSARTVFLTGATAMILPLLLRCVISSGVTGHILVAFLPVCLGYIIFCGMAARRRIDEMLTARFGHEDLSKELAAARDEAVEKRKEAESANESKTTFLANMSHELRTPLNAIIGFSEIIATEALGASNPRYPEYAGDIHSSGTHLLTLINEILDVAKIEAGHMEIDPRPLDLQVAFDAVERIMAIRCQEKNLLTRYSVAPDLPHLVADERAVRQILLNLLSNAVKFTPQGGEIEVTCREGEAGGIVLSVTDTGPGIPANKLALLFQPFSQVDNRFDHHHGGTGLGLALVQGLARLHDGKAWIESREGFGTSVFVYFPLVSIKQALISAAQ
ncbi:MAG: ATP-binding protein [Rhizomicrobium sp.]|nr:ATP-binding protein [Rhizomicrobium sp.]